MNGLVETIAARTTLSRRAVHTAWKPVAEAVVQALVDHVEVNFFGLGHLRSVFRPEQTFTHPITGQDLFMPAENVLILSPAPALFCAANPKWTLDEAETYITNALPEVWDDLDILDARSLLHDPEDILEDAVLDVIVEEVLDAVATGTEPVLLLDGIGELRLNHKDGYIGVHPDTLAPLVHRGRYWFAIEPGLELQAGLAIPD